jgi:hypothetical protein
VLADSPSQFSGEKDQEYEPKFIDDVDKAGWQAESPDGSHTAAEFFIGASRPRLSNPHFALKHNLGQLFDKGVVHYAAGFRVTVDAPGSVWTSNAQ